MTSLFHVIRGFGRTTQTISIMSKTVAPKTIVLAESLKDFDEVVVSMINAVLNTPQGRIAFAQQMMQFGNATPAEALAVAALAPSSIRFKKSNMNRRRKTNGSWRAKRSW
jgi:hypothetical protein